MLVCITLKIDIYHYGLVNILVYYIMWLNEYSSVTLDLCILWLTSTV